MSDSVQAFLNLFLCAVGLWVLLAGRQAIWTTTLRAAWCWAVLTLIVLCAVELVLGLSADRTQEQAEMLRFAAAVFVFTPTIALLGGKRPQNAAWQFVVITLLGVLALPAWELWMRGRGEDFAIDAIRSWFIVVMIVISAANHLPTRFGLAAVQFAAAQTTILWPHLPIVGDSASRPLVWLGCGLLLSAVLTARRAAARASLHADQDKDSQPLRLWSFVWREFRDWYGTVWGVRLMERVNASVEMHNGPIVLGWEGFFWRDAHSPGGETRSLDAAGETTGDRGAGALATRLAPEQQAAIEQSLRNLLRRFVSSQWIEGRLSAGNSPRQGTGSGEPCADSPRN
jgi:hypothetical protein